MSDIHRIQWRTKVLSLSAWSYTDSTDRYTVLANTEAILVAGQAARTLADGRAKGKIVLPTSLTIMDFSWLKDMFNTATGAKK